MLTGQSTDDSGFNHEVFPINKGLFIFGNTTDNLYEAYKSPLMLFIDEDNSGNTVVLSYDIVGQAFNFIGSTITKYTFDKDVEVTGDIYQNGNQVCDNSNNCAYVTTLENIFDQSLNTTDDVIFNTMNVHEMRYNQSRRTRNQI
jgi:hypothetical protein